MTAPNARLLPKLPPLETIRRIHIIGICGTAMGSLAAMFAERGYAVSGSDAMAYPPMSTWLEARGLVVKMGYDASHVPADVDLVVVGNVARRDNAEVLEATRRNTPMLSLPEALRVFFFGDARVLVVTGTHGKTTTSSMAAWMLHRAGLDPSFFIGGVTGNFDSNYRLGGGRVWVVEGDEYDTAWFDKVPKFWHYPAWSATINNIEFDHADIYPNIEEIEMVFTRFAEQVDPRGQLWVNGDDERAMGVTGDIWCELRTFGLGEGCDLRATDVVVGEEGTTFRFVAEGRDLGVVSLPTTGIFNVRNFLGAAGLIGSAGVAIERTGELIEGFIATRKRQEIKGTARGITVVDDFAHHPTAVRETLDAMRARFGERRIWAIFEAKSNTSRRAVFQNDYPRAFASADIVVLSQPWKQDNLPENQKISIEKMASDIEALGKQVHLVPQVDDIVELVAREAREGDVAVGLSGSDFGGLHEKLLHRLRGD